MSVKQAFLAKKKRSATRSAFSFRAKCRLGTARGLLIPRQADLRKLFKSTLNHRLHRHLACVIYKRYRSAKLKRAFEELPKRATALNGGSHLAKSKERFAGGLPTERSARFGKVSKRRRGGLREAFSDAVFGCKSLRSAGQGVKRTAPDRSGAA